MIRIVADWNRLLSLLVLALWIIIGIANGMLDPGFFSWAAMAFAFIWWPEEMAYAQDVPPVILRILAWVILMFPLIAATIVSCVNSDLE